MSSFYSAIVISLVKLARILYTTVHSESCLGALVLAHSLRDNGTNAKLAILYTPDTLQPKTINKLEVSLIPYDIQYHVR